jgi:predicted MFS family arabinose efflux permease
MPGRRSRGMGCGPLLGGVLYDAFSGQPAFGGGLDLGMVAAFGTMGGLGICGLIATIFLMPADDTTVHLGRKRGSLREMTRSPIIRAVFATRITENIGRKAFSAFLPLFGGIILGLSATQIGLLMFINVSASTATQLFAGRLTDHFNKKTLIISTSLLAMTYMALIPELSAFWMLAVLVVLNGCRAALNNNSSSALMVVEGRKYGMATSMATFSLAVAIGEGIGPLLAGAIVDASSYGSAFYVASGAFLCSALLFGWFTRHNPGALSAAERGPISG